MRTQVYIITHKEIVDPKIEGYVPLLAGATLRDDILKSKFLCDNTGINISEWNNAYSELSALFWIWKNVDSDIVGLVHYRRFFVNKFDRIPFHGNYYIYSSKERHKIHVLSIAEIELLLKEKEVIVHRSRKYHWDLLHVLKYYISEECILNMKETMAEYDKVLYEKLGVYLSERCFLDYNMFIGYKKTIDKYCEWIFPLLERIDDNHLKKYGIRYNNRELGYLSEVLFGFWLKENNIQWTEANVLAQGRSTIRKFGNIDFPEKSNVYSIYSMPGEAIGILRRVWHKRRPF